jgi:putative hemolysin
MAQEDTLIDDILIDKGRYQARIARSDAALAACHALRSAAFREGAPDGDAFDARCTHVMVHDTRTDSLVCCFRLMTLPSGSDIAQSYAAQYYTLDALEGFAGPMVEMGRFCIAEGARDADILRVAWAAMTKLVDAAGVELLFGCSSFQGTEAEAYRDTFALLQKRHIAPTRWRPRVKSPAAVRFAEWLGLGKGAIDLKRGRAAMPPLLRTYLLMGGWVSDHAVVDRDLGTLHVFTGLEIAAIPPARKRLLRAAVS